MLLVLSLEILEAPEQEFGPPGWVIVSLQAGQQLTLASNGLRALPQGGIELSVKEVRAFYEAVETVQPNNAYRRVSRPKTRSPRTASRHSA